MKMNDLKEVPKWTLTLARVFFAFIILFTLLLILTPWQQTSQGEGKLMALDPNDREQKINTAVAGKIDKWFVTDGAIVKKGDPIVEIVDIDPQYVERINLERDATKRKYQADKLAAQIALLNYQRQKNLFEQGLVAKKDVEKAQIDYQKLISSEAQSMSSLTKSDVKVSRQEMQLIRAPKDGTILRVLHGAGSVLVKEGDTIATFVPETMKLISEIYIDGNDLPLVYPGRNVRLQFEGWPAIQFSGWPSVAVGTFAGKVLMVDPSVSTSGKFRVLITQQANDNWPDNRFLRQGTRVHAWILLDTVKLGYELWRQFNGFPKSMNQEPDKLNSESKKESKKKEKEEETTEEYSEK